MNSPVGESPATLKGCKVKRNSAGAQVLIVDGDNIKLGALITVGGRIPRKVKYLNPSDSGPDSFTRVKLVGNICGGLPGIIIVSNAGGGQASLPFTCNARCQ
jgi:hypothetical protein